MKFHKLDEFKNGWIVGQFHPNLIYTSKVECGIHKYKKGFKSDGHFHKYSEEINVVVNGHALVQDGPLKKSLVDGDIWIYDVNEESHVEFLEDTTLLVIKSPSIPGDKHYNIEKLPDYGDLYTCEEFELMVNNCYVTDYDGFGCWANETKYQPHIRIKPSEFLKMNKIDWATHVIWFNK